MIAQQAGLPLFEVHPRTCVITVAVWAAGLVTLAVAAPAGPAMTPVAIAADDTASSTRTAAQAPRVPVRDQSHESFLSLACMGVTLHRCSRTAKTLRRLRIGARCGVTRAPGDEGDTTRPVPAAGLGKRRGGGRGQIPRAGRARRNRGAGQGRRPCPAGYPGHGLPSGYRSSYPCLAAAARNVTAAPASLTVRSPLAAGRPAWFCRQPAFCRGPAGRGPPRPRQLAGPVDQHRPTAACNADRMRAAAGQAAQPRLMITMGFPPRGVASQIRNA